MSCFDVVKFGIDLLRELAVIAGVGVGVGVWLLFWLELSWSESMNKGRAVSWLLGVLFWSCDNSGDSNKSERLFVKLCTVKLWFWLRGVAGDEIKLWWSVDVIELEVGVSCWNLLIVNVQNVNESEPVTLSLFVRFVRLKLKWYFLKIKIKIKIKKFYFFFYYFSPFVEFRFFDKSLYIDKNSAQEAINAGFSTRKFVLYLE